MEIKEFLMNFHQKHAAGVEAIAAVVSFQ